MRRRSGCDFSKQGGACFSEPLWGIIPQAAAMWYTSFCFFSKNCPCILRHSTGCSV